MAHVPAARKKISWIKVGIAVGILAAIIVGILWIAPLLKSPGVSKGDTVKFSYTFKFSDGKEISNTSEFKVGELGASFGLDSEKLDEMAAGMKIGESKTITLSAEDAWGEYSEDNLIVENRTSIIANLSVREINRTFDVPPAAFKQVFGEDAVLNKAYSPNSALIWSTKAVSVSNDSVKLSIENKAGEKLKIDEAMFVEIIEVSSDKLKMKLGAEEKTVNTTNGNYTISIVGNDIVAKWTPEIGQSIVYGFSMAKVLSFNDTSVVLDMNSEFAGKNVTVTLEALSVSAKAVAPKESAKSSSSSTQKISGAPTLQTFVMSYCPYGTQMEKGVVKAHELLKDKANFEIRFVSYTMHGDKEDQENKRQICIREEHNDKFWAYLECFLEAGDYAGCISSTGLDEAKINECMTTNADSYMEEDKALNTQYGVQGSPTNILNGKEVQIYPRSPEDVKKAVCDSFETQPDECSETLDTANPSPGFGYSTSSSSSSSSGGCGG